MKVYSNLRINQVDEQQRPSQSFSFTDLSLSTGTIQQQFHAPSNITDARDCKTRESRVKFNRQRRLDAAALTIGTGSGFSAGSGVYGVECGENKPNPVPHNLLYDGGSRYHQFLDGFSTENDNRINGYGGSVVGNKSFPYHQPALCGVTSESLGYGRGGGATFRHTSASEKIRRRMIKNRESAARSRARKQALEAQKQLENTALKKENDLLKRIVRFLLAIVRTKRMKLPALSRSFSAPF